MTEATSIDSAWGPELIRIPIPIPMERFVMNYSAYLNTSDIVKCQQKYIFN